MEGILGRRACRERRRVAGILRGTAGVVSPRTSRRAGRERRRQARARAAGFVVASIFALLVVVACGESSPPASSPAPTSGRSQLAELLTRAKNLRSQGFVVEAARLLDERKDELTENERREAYGVIAGYYHEGRVYEKALESAELALANGQRSAELLFVLGDSLRAQRRWKDARARLEELLGREPEHVRGKLALARVVARAGDPRDALRLFESYLAASPEDGVDRPASLDLARALRAVKEYRRAADTFARLLVADPFDAVACSELAQTYFRRRMRQQGKFMEQIYKAISQSAFEEFVEERLRASGMTSFALGQKALNQIRQKRYLGAFQSYETAMRFDRGDPRVRILYANLCRQFRRPTDGRRALREALDAGAVPASGLWMTRALIELDGDDVHAGLESARSGLAALEREGDLGGTDKGQGAMLTLLLGTARGALETGDLDAARSAVTRASDASPDAWEPSYWLGRVELAAKRLAPAAAAFALARTRDAGGFADLDYWSAVLLNEQGDVPAAVEKLEELLRVKPGHEDAYDLLAKIFERSGDRRGEELTANHQSVRSALGRIEELESIIDRRPLQEVGAEYLELGRLYLQLRDPMAFDFFFLASDLLPENAEALRQLLSGMTRSPDIFMRLQCLHRLLDIEPDDPDVLAEVAGIYIRLNLRLDIARQCAERLHRLTPSAASYRLVGEVELLEGNVEEGRRWLTEGLARFPGDARLKEALESGEK